MGQENRNLWIGNPITIRSDQGERLVNSKPVAKLEKDSANGRNLKITEWAVKWNLEGGRPWL